MRRYIRSVVRALLAIDSKNEYVIYYDHPGQLGKNPGAVEKVINLPGRLLADHVGVPLAARQDKIDVLFCTKNVVPLLTPCKSVVTFHDLGYMADSGYYPFKDTAYMKLAMRWSVRKRNAIIAISQSTKADLVSRLGAEPEKIRCIHHAADEPYRRLEDRDRLESVRAKYNLPSDFILSVAALGPRKNLPNLIDAFSLVRRSPGLNHKLVMVGAASWNSSSIRGSASFRKTSAQLLSRRLAFFGVTRNWDCQRLSCGSRIRNILPSLGQALRPRPFITLSPPCPRLARGFYEQINIVTAIKVTPSNVSDTTVMPELLDTTSDRFTMAEVSADKAYLSEKNIHHIKKLGADAYIPFKSNTTGKGSILWRQLYGRFISDPGTFKAHYHRRSNVETAFSMVKAKFGDSVRAKSDTGQVNEVLLKFLYHNICVLIHACMSWASRRRLDRRPGNLEWPAS